MRLSATPVVLALCSIPFAAACGTDTGQAGAGAGALNVPPPMAGGSAAPPADPGATPPAPPSSGAAVSPQDRAAEPLGKRGAWRITTYYTAVQSFHRGKAKAVRGCPKLHCSHGTTPLGSYPAGFLKVIQMEGSGRITSGPHAGRYLNWSHSVGWWLDDTTRDSGAAPLRAWGSAAADRSVLARGRRFVIMGCGRDGNGRPVPAKVCDTFRKARWTVTDLFRPGYGGEHHADVYIGEETGPGFAGSDLYTTLRGATLASA
ncbi:hypothetical protein [Actinomadura xylanilytica]|uniref:hypothetical protein n=1 Tax=Actinomadura xylanilytica TaxID=887459 RepID=UPI00255B2893|nr:hypothetical protein [Actinomadura xylanilytica]MDL4777213.1 hypothetical protein [Actinomadura xylanilytica]